MGDGEVHGLVLSLSVHRKHPRTVRDHGRPGREARPPDTGGIVFVAFRAFCYGY